MSGHAEGHAVQDHSEWVAKEKSENVAQGLDIKTNGFGKVAYDLVHEWRHCG